MKRGPRIWIGLAVAAAVAVSGVLPAEAAIEGGPLRKLTRGFLNLATGWLEIPSQLGKEIEQKGTLAGVTVGMASGVVRFLGRTLVGALELVTFPIPNPTTGYGPVIEPEYVILRDADG